MNDHYLDLDVTWRAHRGYWTYNPYRSGLRFDGDTGNGWEIPVEDFDHALWRSKLEDSYASVVDREPRPSLFYGAYSR